MSPTSVIRPPARLFPDGVGTAFADGSESPPPLYADEQDAIRSAVASRQREFALGRWCARRALAEIGVAPTEIPVGTMRAPCWPPGTVGSITHCRGFIGAVVATSERLQSIGFDAERAEPLDPDLIPLICTAAEVDWMRRRQDGGRVDWAKMIFSAKEATHKCIWPLCGRMLDFSEVTLTVDATRFEFSASAARPDTAVGVDFTALRGRMAITAGIVFTCAFVAPPSS